MGWSRDGDREGGGRPEGSVVKEWDELLRMGWRPGTLVHKRLFPALISSPSLFKLHPWGETTCPKELGVCLREVGQGHSPHLCLSVLSRQAGLGCGRRLLAPSPGPSEQQQPQQQARPQTKGPARRCSLVQPRAARTAGAEERALGA